MQSQISNEIKKLFKLHSLGEGYKYQESLSVIARPETNLLFNISGGVLFQDELLGLKKPYDTHLASEQKCVRMNDLTKIGVTGRHHIFFEMLNRYLFYSGTEKEVKNEFITSMYSFLVNELGLDKTRLSVTVHPKDDITLAAWKNNAVTNITFDNKNIFIYPYEAANKSALRSEILWENDVEKHTKIELFNMDFTQFNSKEVFNNPTNLISASAGGALDRLVSAIENKSSDYENSMWCNSIQKISENRHIDIIQAHRLMDFANAAFQIINDGVLPNNSEKHSKQLRRILRIMLDYCIDNGVLLNEVVDIYPENLPNVTKSKLLELVLCEKEKYDIHVNKKLKEIKSQIKKSSKKNLTREYLKSIGLPESRLNELLLSNQINTEKVQ